MFFNNPQFFRVEYKHRQEVWNWAEKSNIRIEYNGSHGWKDVWRVVNADDCLLFILRWA